MFPTKKAVLITGAVLGISLTSALTIHPLQSLMVHGLENEPYVLVLNDENSPTISDGDGNGVSNPADNVVLNYTNASNSEGYHVCLSSGGTIEKTRPSYDLDEITATFTGSLQFECDWTNPFSDEHIVGSLQSGVAFPIKGNYWKITALENTSISSINLTYGCSNESYAPSTSTSQVLGIANEDNFVRLFENNNDIYFSVKGNYNISTGRLTKNDITLVGDNEGEVLSCDHLDILSTSQFIAYFNLTDFYGDTSITNGYEFYCHLYVRGEAAFGNAGDVSAKNCTFEASTFDISPTKTVKLVDYDWMNGGVHIHMAKLVFKHNIFRLDTTTNLARLEEESGTPYYVVRLIGDSAENYTVSDFVLEDPTPNKVDNRYPISITASKYEVVDGSHIDVYFDLTSSTTYVLYDKKDIGTFVTPHIKYSGSEIGDVIKNDSYADSSTKVWINSIYNSTTGKHYSLFIRDQIFSLSITTPNIVLDDTDMLASFEIVNGNINYVLDIHVNDLTSFDYSLLTLAHDGGANPLSYVKHVDDGNGNTKVYFDTSSLNSSLGNSTKTYAAHLYYNGSAYYSVTAGNIMNMHKGIDANQVSSYATIPTAHSSTPMYLDGENQSITNGDISAKIIYRWSMFSFIIWNNSGTATPTMSNTTSLATFFNLYFQNRTERTGPVLYIKFNKEGDVKPNTLGVGDSTSLPISGFACFSDYVEIAFDITRLNKVNLSEYCHLFMNGSKLKSFNGNGDVKTKGSKSTGSSKVSYGLNALRCSTNGVWYELKEAWSMLIVCTGGDINVG